MRSDGFIIDEFISIDECVETIKMGSVQTCILFPENFAIEDGKTNNIVFYVDSSRTNFVYQIIDSVSSNLGVETDALSKNLTGGVLDVVTSTKSDIVDVTEEVVKLKAKASGLTSKTNEAASTAESMDLEMTEVDTEDLIDGFEDLEDSMDALEVDAQTLLDNGNALKSELDDVYNSTAFSNFKSSLIVLKSAINDAEDDSDDARDDFAAAIAVLHDSLEEIESEISSAVGIHDKTVNQIKDLKERAGEVQDGLSEVKSSLESVSSNINSLSITSSETISNPITTSIEQISQKGDKLSFMFPYLMMLVAMFVGILLAGTLIIMEKRSKSPFRT